MLGELKAGKLDSMLGWARQGAEVGLDAVDILLNHPGIDEVELLPRIAAAVHEEIGCPIALDSRDPEALDAALAVLQPNKAMINSISAERDCIEGLMPLAAKYGAVVVGMPTGHLHGLPKTAEGRLAEARVIIEAAAAHGIPKEDIVIDAICLASAAEPGSMQVTLDTLKGLRQELGVSTLLGIGNAGYGMPDQTYVDLAYLISAVPWGLDAALVDPSTPGLVESVKAVDFLVANDPYGKRYIQNYRAKERRTG
jgi:5-methyltetrahydrofolate--homocysteine methyltransferase